MSESVVDVTGGGSGVVDVSVRAGGGGSGCSESDEFSGESSVSLPLLVVTMILLE